MEPLISQLALLDVLTPADEGWRHEHVLAVVRGLQSSPVARNRLLRMLPEAFQFSHFGEDALADLGLESHAAHWDVKDSQDAGLELSEAARKLMAEVRCDVIGFEGLNAMRLLSGEGGTHLCVLASGRLIPFQVELRIVPEDATADDVIRSVLAEHLDWLKSRRSQPAADSDPLFSLKPAVRIYDERGLILDFATGQALEEVNLSAPRLLKDLILARLPLPAELVTG